MYADTGSDHADGMTETCSVLLHPLRTKAVLGSAGQLITDTEAKVLRPDGSECGIDEAGELLIRGPQTALGYFNNPKATNVSLHTLQSLDVPLADFVSMARAGDVLAWRLDQDGR